jgi:hypothetical protein
MRAAIEIDGALNSGANGVLLKNCSIASGETAASQFYIQNFRRSRKTESVRILAAFKSRLRDSAYFLTDGAGEFRIMETIAGNDSPILRHTVRKATNELKFSFAYAKLNEFADFDCILLTAFGAVVAFSEASDKIIEIEASQHSSAVSGVCAFGNRIVATFEGTDLYHWGDLLKADFGSGHAGSEYGNDRTLAVRRTGSRLAVFTTRTIEIKDLSQDPDLPFQGYLYQNNHDVGADVRTIKEIDGALYFLGREMNSLRFIYSLKDGVLRKLTGENQSRLLALGFDRSGVMQEDERTFFLLHGRNSFGIDIASGSLFQMEETPAFLDYLNFGGRHIRFASDGIYEAEAGEGPPGKIRLPRHDFGGTANIRRLEFTGEFLSSSPGSASLTAERGWFQEAAAGDRGFFFFLVGIRRLNDLEFSAGGNFRLTRIVADYELLTNAWQCGARQ